MKADRSKDFWMAKAAAEGDSSVGVGSSPTVRVYRITQGVSTTGQALITTHTPKVLREIADGLEACGLLELAPGESLTITVGEMESDEVARLGEFDGF